MELTLYHSEEVYKETENTMPLEDDDEVDLDNSELEIELKVSKSGKRSTIVLTSTTPMTTHDIIMGLEWYITELARAETQLSKSDTRTH